MLGAAYNGYNAFPRLERSESVLRGKCRLYLNVTNTMPRSELIFELFRNFSRIDLSNMTGEELDR